VGIVTIIEKFDSEYLGNAIDRNKLAESLLTQLEPTPPYGTYNHAALIEKLSILQILLKGEPKEFVEEEARITREFFDRCFQDFEAPTLDKIPGSFGFVVPPRVRREVLGESDDYMAEWEEICPILRHFDSSIAQRVLVGLPPFLVDSYGTDDDGRCGYMLCAPMHSNMKDDLGKSDPLNHYLIGKKIMNDTLDLAKKLDIRTVGWGATLPRFLFKVNEVGDKLDTQGMELTTGHAGTVWLMGETIKSLTEKGRKGFNGNIAILGAGSIGVAFIEHLRQNLGYTGIITVFDSRLEALDKVLDLGYKDIRVVANEKELIQSSDTIVCAATTTLSFEDLDIQATDVDGKVFVDDSQPGCVDLQEVKERGGEVVWVIGQDASNNGDLTRSAFSYNGFGPIKKNEVWGCELEVYLAYLAQKAREKMKHTSKKIASLAVSRHVTYRDVEVFGNFARQHNARVAQLQARGEYLDIT
jgi:hypothetical protein